MTRFLVDTNHIGDTINRVLVVRDQIQRRRRAGDVFGTCGTVMCELLVGLVQRVDESACRIRLGRLLNVMRIWPIDMHIANRYADIYLQLRSSGKTLSFVDITIAATALELNATVLTTDLDFRFVNGLKTENWL